MKIWTDLRSILSQITHLTDRQTRRTDGRADRILIARPRAHCMQRGKNVRTFYTKLPNFVNVT